MKPASASAMIKRCSWRERDKEIESLRNCAIERLNDETRYLKIESRNSQDEARISIFQFRVSPFLPMAQ
jgi:hypothetical protein